MSESVALLAQIEQAPKTANDEDAAFNQDKIKGNDTNDHVFDYNCHVFRQYFQGFCVFDHHLIKRRISIFQTIC